MSAFLGRGWQFPVCFDRRNGEAAMVEGVEDIEESLGILLGTRPGERVMLSGYGCGLRGVMFDALNDSTVTELQEKIRDAILFYEPRIELEHIGTDWGDPREGKLMVTLAYRVIATNTRHNLVYPLYLDQASEAVSPY
ncbi:GPW/gp25 family protein [Paludibacterium paludis]|uniref:IraD/Gp25-like domain-containing protein n=1 Tax=Paludibacterium paludis TaxID=1225769 RepID=A0A918P1S0_9NEIS|nr:GPW/gp25 family protein [Paludibacterium paludis]GGY13852.1 hypothetical protein GCM10011289_16510 [Paludibacterium paludis]